MFHESGRYYVNNIRIKMNDVPKFWPWRRFRVRWTALSDRQLLLHSVRATTVRIFSEEPLSKMSNWSRYKTYLYLQQVYLSTHVNLATVSNAFWDLRIMITGWRFNATTWAKRVLVLIKREKIGETCRWKWYSWLSVASKNKTSALSNHNINKY